MYLGQLCLSKGILCFLIHKSCVRSIKKYFFVRKYAAIPESLKFSFSSTLAGVYLLLLLLLLLLNP